MISIKEAAIAFWRLQKWVSAVDIERKIAAESSLRTIQEYLEANEIKVIDLTGELYDPGLSVEVMYFEDEDDESDKTPTITEMMRPIIMQGGSVIEFGQVVIAKNPTVLSKTEESTVMANEAEMQPESKDEVSEDRLDSETDKNIKNNIFIMIPSIIATIACIGLIVYGYYTFDKIQNKYDSILENQLSISGRIENIQNYIDNENVRAQEVYSAEEKNKNQVYWKSYIVNSGDSLLSICNDNNIDYNAYKQVIMSASGIEDENIIYDGQAILLPTMENLN